MKNFLKQWLTFVFYNVAFFSFIYVWLNVNVILSDLFSTNNSVIAEETISEDSWTWMSIAWPSFVLFDSKAKKDYLSFPGKWELEDSIRLLWKLSEDKQPIEEPEIKKTWSVKSSEINNKKDDILDLTTELTSEEWKKYWEKAYVSIPKINIEAPISFPSVEEYDLEWAILKTLENWVAHRPETQKPDQSWNFFLIWHSSNYPWIKSKYNNIFSKIPRLENGDQVFVYYEWRKFIYEVYTKFVVPSNALDVYWFIPWHNMTLMTCYPVGTDKSRMIVRLKLKKP